MSEVFAGSDPTGSPGSSGGGLSLFESYCASEGALCAVLLDNRVHVVEMNSEAELRLIRSEGGL